MSRRFTRRQILAQAGIAVADIHTLDPHELCCAMAADAKTADKDLFELKKVADGVYAAIAGVKQAAAGAPLEDIQKTVANQLAPKYEAGMSKHPLGRYRDRIGLNVEMVYLKTVKKS